jgi:hypothetical protein
LKILKKLRGKKIVEAKYWASDEGRVCLELDFDNDTFFCLDVEPAPQLKTNCYLDKQSWGNSKKFRPLKECK